MDHHVRHAVLDRDFTVGDWAPIAFVRTGDPCPKCSGTLSVDRGIEVGQVFQLGTKYAEALGAMYTDAEGASHPMVMGCYGVGISRTVAAITEEHHDEHGLIWPAPVAPYDVHVLALPGRGDTAAAVVDAADELAKALSTAGLDVLYDDRDVTPGVKFADADLLGMPIQLTVGAKGIARGVVERKVRATGARDDLPIATAADAVLAAR
jgi:prolyl-tRNA synthetase